MKKRLIFIVCLLVLVAGAFLTVFAAENPNCPSEGVVFLPHPESYEQYYICIDGIAYLEYCPDGLWWNSACCICDWPENVIEDEFW